MSLDAWGRVDERDVGRAGRLAGAYVAATAVVAAVLALAVLFGGQIKKQVFEEETEVTFVPPEPAPPPEPMKAPPPPPPPPKPRSAAPGPAALGSRRDAVPTEIPTSPPATRDPGDAVPEGPEGEGDPNGVVGGTGGGGAIAAPVARAPEPAAPPPPVMQIAEVATQPIARAKAMPAYPDDARRQGIEAVIVVKFVVTEAGAVDDVKILRGHPLFDAAVLAAVRLWTFEPATIDGKVVRTARMVKIPFRLKAT